MEIVRSLLLDAKDCLRPLVAAVTSTTNLGHGGESKPRRCVGPFSVVCCMTGLSQFRLQVDVKLLVMEGGNLNTADGGVSVTGLW